MFRCGFLSGRYMKLGMGFSIRYKTGMRNSAMYAWPLGKCWIEEAGLRIPISFLLVGSTGNRVEKCSVGGGGFRISVFVRVD